jgi:hypothetical protein
MAMQQHGGRVKYADRCEPCDDAQKNAPAKPAANDQPIPERSLFEVN